LFSSVTDVHNAIAERAYVTSGPNPAQSEPYNYTLNVCSNSSVTCSGEATEAAACQRNTGNNQMFVLGQLSLQTLR